MTGFDTAVIGGKAVAELPAVELSPGYWVLCELAMRGDVPRGNPDLLTVYKEAEATARSARYTINKFVTSTPFGYFVSVRDRESLDSELGPLVEKAEAYNQILGDHFRCEINVIYVPIDTVDKLARKRLTRYTLEQLQQLRARVLNLDPQTDKKTFAYTHDSTKHLGIVLKGDYARACARAVTCARKLAHDLRVGEKTKVWDNDLMDVDAAIGLFERAVKADEDVDTTH